MGMDPVQWVFLGLELLQQLTILNIFSWLLNGGWKFVLRTIGFFFDKKLVSFIGRIYEYFLQVLHGTMLSTTCSSLLTSLLMMTIIQRYGLLKVLIQVTAGHT